ncbi:hypothetical protein HK104_006453, partial [Borealophlyctis nickersoniae]
VSGLSHFAPPSLAIDEKVLAIVMDQVARKIAVYGGPIEYMFTQASPRLPTCMAAVTVAKGWDWRGDRARCMMQLETAGIENEEQGLKLEYVYGILTNAEEWRFLRYQPSTRQFRESDRYMSFKNLTKVTRDDIETVAAVINGILNEQGERMDKILK